MTFAGPLPDVVLTWRLDGLSTFFAIVILAISAVVTVYAAGHRAHQPGFRGSGILYALFILAMLGVVLAGDAFSFLLAWETMSLASFGLVLTDHRRAEVREAAWTYVVMTHTATAFIVVAFLLLARSAGSLVFADWTAGAGAIDAMTASLVFGLGLVGFGTKAGMIPLHVWLPRAHPVAPAHVSALMSGVMIKLGIYGLVRLTFDWLAPGPAWWGALILVLGAISAVLGVLYALMEHDLKRLLAYHSSREHRHHPHRAGDRSGRAIARQRAGRRARAWRRAVPRCESRDVQSAPLPRCRGDRRRRRYARSRSSGRAPAANARHRDVLHRRQRRDLRRAPLNGFVSEWLTFQGLLALGRAAADPLTALLPLISAGALALTGALAVACFVKASGVSLLGLPRGPRAAAAHEAGALELVAMVVLAAACVVLGLAAAPVVGAIGVLVPMSVPPIEGALGLPDPASGRLVLPVIAFALVAAGAFAALAPRLLGPVRTRVSETWACGMTLQPIHGYSSTAFAKPIRLMFRGIVRPVREVEIVHRAGTRFVASVHYSSHVAPVFERYVYGSVTDGLVFLSRIVRRAQNGSLQTYLAYVLAALLVAVALAR